MPLETIEAGHPAPSKSSEPREGLKRPRTDEEWSGSEDSAPKRAKMVSSR